MPPQYIGPSTAQRTQTRCGPSAVNPAASNASSSAPCGVVGERPDPGAAPTPRRAASSDCRPRRRRPSALERPPSPSPSMRDAASDQEAAVAAGQDPEARVVEHGRGQHVRRSRGPRLHSASVLVGRRPPTSPAGSLSRGVARRDHGVPRRASKRRSKPNRSELEVAEGVGHRAVLEGVRPRARRGRSSTAGHQGLRRGVRRAGADRAPTTARARPAPGMPCSAEHVVVPTTARLDGRPQSWVHETSLVRLAWPHAEDACRRGRSRATGRCG